MGASGLGHRRTARDRLLAARLVRLGLLVSAVLFGDGVVARVIGRGWLWGEGAQFGRRITSGGAIIGPNGRTSPSGRGTARRALGCGFHRVSTVWQCPLDLSAYVALGQQIEVGEQACPDCGQRLGGWGGYWRWVRGPGTRMAVDSALPMRELPTLACTLA
jgi:hypothetical protein